MANKCKKKLKKAHKLISLLQISNNEYQQRIKALEGIETSLRSELYAKEFAIKTKLAERKQGRLDYLHNQQAKGLC